MNEQSKPGRVEGQPLAAGLLDALIRAGLILALALLCYRALAPFLVLLAWSLILAVTLYPLHLAVARRFGGRHALASTAIAVLGVALIVVPSAALMSSLGDTVQQLISDVQHNELQIPAPRPGVANLPLVGDKVYAVWEKAHADLPALVHSLQPKIGELAKGGLSMVASIGGAILQFIAALIIAAIMTAYGEAGGRAVNLLLRQFKE